MMTSSYGDVFWRDRLVATWMMVWMLTSCGEDRMTYVGDDVDRIVTWKKMSMATSFYNVEWRGL